MLTVEAFTCNPFSENTYVVSGNDKSCIIIDPGVSNTYERELLMNYIHSNQLIPQMIFLTHTHIDHVYGLQYVKTQFPEVPIVAHPLAEQGIKTTELVAKLYGLQVDNPPSIDTFIDEGETITLGDQPLKVLFCPGHAPDHLVLYAEEAGFAIVGDVIFNGSIGRTDLPGGNYQTLMDSIHQKILVLPSETVIYSGHGPETTIQEEIKHNPFLK
jgi:hydroxyacylglutathione hydrolase